MTDRPGSMRTTRRFMAVALTSGVLLAACGAELPTSAELEGMDVAAAQQRAVALAPSLESTKYIVDGKEVAEAEAKALSANRIASIYISKLDKKTSELRIATRSASDSIRTLVIRDTNRADPSTRTFEGLIFVDGVRATEAAMKMPPDRIESIEVIKGAAAEKLYGAEGSKGVIKITTKK